MTTGHVNAGSRSNSGDLMATNEGHAPRRMPRLAVDVLVVAGSGLLLYSAAIHFYLWNSQGYRHIPTIGPLFLAQAIVGALLAVATAIFRLLPLVVAAAGMSVSSIGALLISIWWGLFGWQDSFSAPYVGLVLWVEAFAALFLGLAAVMLAIPWLAHLRRHEASKA
jgi:hypothetical protein